MKKISLFMICLFSAFLFFSNAAISQDTGDTGDTTVQDEAVKDDTIKDDAVKEDTVQDNTTGDTEHVTTEDTTADHAEKVYESEDVQSLKGKPKAYTDGYNNYINDKVKFKISDIDNIMQDQIFYNIDKGQDQKYTEPFTISDEGTHLVQYYSVDKMGNKEIIKSVNVIVDKTAPEVTLTVKAPFSKTGDKIYASEKFSYEYTIAAKDNIVGVAGVEYAVDGGEYKEYMNPFSINSLAPVKITINAEDKVGNLTKKFLTKIVDENGAILAESVDDIAITVDKTAPAVEIKPDKELFKKDNVNVASKDYKYTLTATDQESGVKSIYYRIDNKNEFILYTGELQFNTNGMHKIEAIAKDNVGNISSTAVLDVFVDIIPAESTIQFVTE